MAGPFWMSAFLDLASPDFDRGVAYWSAVTGYAVSPQRGEHDEFATLLPPDGDDYLRVQRLDAGPSRIHLDLHVTDPAAGPKPRCCWVPRWWPDRTRSTSCCGRRAGSPSAWCGTRLR